jgi:hypothetical protein
MPEERAFMGLSPFAIACYLVFSLITSRKRNVDGLPCIFAPPKAPKNRDETSGQPRLSRVFPQLFPQLVENFRVAKGDPSTPRPLKGFSRNFPVPLQ